MLCPRIFQGLFSLPGECPSLPELVLCCDLPVSGSQHVVDKSLWGLGTAPYYIRGTGVTLLQYKGALLLLPLRKVDAPDFTKF